MDGQWGGWSLRSKLGCGQEAALRLGDSEWQVVEPCLIQGWV